MNKRPGLDPFLEALARDYNTIVFTAAMPDYAGPVLDYIDPKGTLFHQRLYRSSCRQVSRRVFGLLRLFVFCLFVYLLWHFTSFLLFLHVDWYPAKKNHSFLFIFLFYFVSWDISPVVFSISIFLFPCSQQQAGGHIYLDKQYKYRNNSSM